MVAKQTPTQQDLAKLFSDLSKDENRKPAILSLTAEYSERSSHLKITYHLPF